MTNQTLKTLNYHLTGLKIAIADLTIAEASKQSSLELLTDVESILEKAINQPKLKLIKGTHETTKTPNHKN